MTLEEKMSRGKMVVPIEEDYRQYHNANVGTPIVYDVDNAKRNYTYKEAFELSDSCDGIYKKVPITLLDDKGNILFIIIYGGTSVLDGRTIAISPIISDDETLYYPAVESAYYSVSPTVPVYLNNYTRNILLDALKNVRATTGKEQTIKQQINTLLKSEKTLYYVKPESLWWFPTNTNNCATYLQKAEDNLLQAEKALGSAKKILALAGITTFI